MKLLVSGATTFNNPVIKAHRCFYLCSQSSESGDGQTRESQEGEDKSESNQKQTKICPLCTFVQWTSLQ